MNVNFSITEDSVSISNFSFDTLVDKLDKAEDIATNFMANQIVKLENGNLLFSSWIDEHSQLTWHNREMDLIEEICEFDDKYL